MERNSTKEKKNGKESKQSFMGINVHRCEDRKRMMNNNNK